MQYNGQVINQSLLEITRYKFVRVSVGITSPPPPPPTYFSKVGPALTCTRMPLRLVGGAALGDQSTGGNWCKRGTCPHT